MNDIRSFLEGIRNGSISVDDAVLELKKKPFEDLGFAKVDIHRKIRQGAAEVIYGSGKTPEQIIGIIDAMKQNGQNTILITRLGKEAAGIVSGKHEIRYYENARIAVAGPVPSPMA